jgi:hypothetical protein
VLTQTSGCQIVTGLVIKIDPHQSAGVHFVREMTVKIIAGAALALAALTTTAFAEPTETPKPQAPADQVMAQAAPVELTEVQMDRVTAGQNINVLNIGVAGVSRLPTVLSDGTAAAFARGKPTYTETTIQVPNSPF